MLLAFSLVLLVLIVGIVANIFSIFWPFFENLSSVVDYNMAYYGAVWSVERWMLVTRYKKPGFEGSWWFIAGTSIGPDSDFLSDFGRFGDGSNGMIWAINSRTNRIPSTGKWNVEYILSSADSADYNILGKNYSESFLLSYDNTNIATNYYTWSSDANIIPYNYAVSPITARLRLPPKLYSGFGWFPEGLLCDYSWSALCNRDGDDLYNDIVATWIVQWEYGLLWEFTIFPTQSVNSSVSPKTVITNKDNTIRKSDINDVMVGAPYNQLSFGNANDFSPLLNWWKDVASHNFVSDNPGTTFLKNSWFVEIFDSTDIKNLRIKLSLADLLYSRNEDIYPFLEYYFDFGSQQIADRFYTIVWNWRVGQYNIQLIFNKPTSRDSTIGEFDVIF